MMQQPQQWGLSGMMPAYGGGMQAAQMGLAGPLLPTQGRARCSADALDSTDPRSPTPALYFGHSKQALGQ